MTGRILGVLVFFGLHPLVGGSYVIDEAEASIMHWSWHFLMDDVVTKWDWIGLDWIRG